MSKFSLIISLFLIIVSVWGQTHVSGTVSGVWDSGGSPYIIDDSIEVSDSLIITSGVTVMFDNIYGKITINPHAKFVATGDESDSIYFLPSDTTAGWQYITLDHAKLCSLEYCYLTGQGEISDTVHYLGCLNSRGSGKIYISNTKFHRCGSDSTGAIKSYEDTSFTIVNSDFEDNFNMYDFSPGCFGGAISLYSPKDTIKIVNCKFVHNISAYSGGAIGIRTSSSPVIVDSNYFSLDSSLEVSTQGGAIQILNVPKIYFRGNIIDSCKAGQGGGFYANGFDSLFCSNNRFEGNIASGDIQDFGGATYFLGNYVSIYNNEFNNNSSGSSGGAVAITNFGSSDNWQVIIESNDFNYNNRSAIYLSNVNLDMSLNNFIGNLNAGYGGALTFNYPLDVSIDRNYFYGNNSSSYGGAICLVGNSKSKDVSITNSIFVNNTGRYGGAVNVRLYGKTIIMNSTFEYNNGTVCGGALSLERFSSIAIANCAFYNDTSSNNDEITMMLDRCNPESVRTCTLFVANSMLDTEKIYLEDTLAVVSLGNMIFTGNPDFIDSLCQIGVASDLIDSGASFVDVPIWADTTIYPPNYDYLDTIRPLAAAYDIGAYEWIQPNIAIYTEGSWSAVANDRAEILASSDTVLIFAINRGSENVDLGLRILNTVPSYFTPSQDSLGYGEFTLWGRFDNSITEIDTADFGLYDIVDTIGHFADSDTFGPDGNDIPSSGDNRFQRLWFRLDSPPYFPDTFFTIDVEVFARPHTP